MASVGDFMRTARMAADAIAGVPKSFFDDPNIRWMAGLK